MYYNRNMGPKSQETNKVCKGEKMADDRESQKVVERKTENCVI